MPNDIFKTDEGNANPPSGENGGGVTAAQAVAAAEAAKQQSADPNSPRKRGRPPKNGSSGAGAGGVSGAERAVAKALESQLEALHAPEAWASLLGAPADVGAAITGRKHWELSEQERKTLGATGSAAARAMMITNPKALALVMVSSAMLAVYLPRLTVELKRLKEQKETEAKK